MGKRRGGELGVNKKGTPLYSREDIREQYCINDKELQVLDRQGNKGLFGCFSNQGQPGISPCSGGSKGRKSLLGSCIARTSSEEELQNQIQLAAKRPISPGLRSTTWNGHQRFSEPRHDEEEGFDEQYFRRRPKSFCMPPGGSLGPQGRYLPQGAPGLSVLPPMGPQLTGLPPPGIYGEVRPSAETDQRIMGFNSHPMVRQTHFPSGAPPTLDPCSPFVGGYTLPPTAAFFPMGSYSTSMQTTVSTTLVEMQHDSTGLTQPNTPDLLIHRRQGGTPEVSLDDRKQKHVSFDSSSLLRSQTLATMDESTFQRTQTTQSVPPTNPGHSTPSKSYERLIDGKMTPDYEYFQQVLPPELARQILIERLKRNSMRTQATQTDTSRNRHSSHIPISPRTAQKVFMVSEGVQTNGFSNGSAIPLLKHSGFSNHPNSKCTSTSPTKADFTHPVQIRPNGSAVSTNMATFKLQHNPEWNDVNNRGSSCNPQANYIISQRPPEKYLDQTDGHYYQNLHPPQKPKISSRSMSQSDILGSNDALIAIQRSQQQPKKPPTLKKQLHHHHQKPNESPQRRKNQGFMPTTIQHGHHHHHHHHHRPHTHRLHKSHSDGELLEDEEMNSGDRNRSRFRSCKNDELVAKKDYSSQIGVLDFGKDIPVWDDCPSDRDLPELAPIKSSKISKEDPDDLEIDLGQKLSPLGSNSSLQDLIDDRPGTLISDENIITWSEVERKKFEHQSPTEDYLQLHKEDSSCLNHPLSAGEDNSEDAEEEHVTSYLEQRPLIIKSGVDVDKSPGSHKSSSSESFSEASGFEQKVVLSPWKNSDSGCKIGNKDMGEANYLIIGEFENSDCQKRSKDESDNQVQVASSEPTPAMLRKQELTLDLQKEASSMPSAKQPEESTSPDESSSENSLMWQRLPMGTGDVKKKRAAFESQIRCLAEDAKPKVLNGKARTPSSGAVRKIVSEERLQKSPLGASGLARSPAMHSGFRSEDWVVERTPVNTPVNDRVLVGTINLSDEENSCHASSEELCKSSGATTPLDSIRSSFEPIISNLSKDDPEKSNLSNVHKETIVTRNPSLVGDSSKTEQLENEESSKKETGQEPLMAPPEGFGDSPEHHPTKRSFGLQEATFNELLPQEELLIAEVFSPLTMPKMQITEAFQSETNLSDPNNLLKTTQISPPDTALATIPSHQKLERLSERKSSSGSIASRTSGCSRSRSRSRSKERLLSKLACSEEIVISTEEDDDIKGFQVGAYDKNFWAFIGNLSGSFRPESTPGPLVRSASIESTQSEREFKKKYQAITHRMVHRKSSAVMYNRILEKTFECNKTVRVRRVNGEFGFRIHGSRPVVISAIEPNTPAETSKLEVGDIILTINGINVLDLPHTEVVKTAQTGNDELELGLARVPESGCPEDPLDTALGKLDDSLTIIFSGYLWKLSQPGFQGGEAKWSKRFFILRADSCLYFFKHENECRPLGAILLRGCSIIEGSDLHGLEKSFTFRLIFSAQKQTSQETSALTNKVLYFAAESKEEKLSWFSIIQQSAQSQNHADDPWRVLSEKRHNLAPCQFLKPDCKGHLFKLDSKTRSWKRRFCILADSCLFIYSDCDSNSATATLCLQGYKAQSTGSMGSRRHVFELMPPEQGMKFFYFMAETETEKKRWLASLEYSMDRWLKLS